ncbi:hypothetical protein HDU83_007969 [Entophlyctis luteolus]|nr:hypothetical protein HDU83_007969 [Entophlyctis luteolus]
MSAVLVLVCDVSRVWGDVDVDVAVDGDGDGANRLRQLAAAALPPEDVRRVFRFRRIIDQRRALAACLLSRILVRRMLRLSPHVPLLFGRSEHGRPFLISPEAPHFDFNVSHHGDFCVVAGCESAPIGIDVMKVELPLGDTATSFLAAFKDNQITEQEWCTIMECANNAIDPSAAKLHAFFRLWCLKEAYTKALGLGLGVDFKAIEFQSSSSLWESYTVCRTEVWEDNIILTVNGERQDGWFFLVHYLDALHPVVIAVKSAETRKEVISFEMIVRESLDGEAFGAVQWPPK